MTSAHCHCHLAEAAVVEDGLTAELLECGNCRHVEITITTKLRCLACGTIELATQHHQFHFEPPPRPTTRHLFGQLLNRLLEIDR